MKWSAVFKMAKNVYRFFRRGKYSSYLSKTKDAQVKLVEDFGTFFNQSMLRYDEMIAALKGKGKKDTDFETWQEEIAAAALKQQNNEKKFSMKEFFSEDNIKKFFSKETAKTFTDEFGKAFKAELKKPENMFNKVKEKIGDERIDSTKKTLGVISNWIKDVKNIAVEKKEERLDFGYGEEFSKTKRSKSERLKEKFGVYDAKERYKQAKNLFKDVKEIMKKEERLDFGYGSEFNSKKSSKYQKLKERMGIKVNDKYEDMMFRGIDKVKGGYSGTKNWFKDVRSIAAGEDRLDFGYGDEFGSKSKSTRLKEKFGVYKAKEAAEKFQLKALNFFDKSLKTQKKEEKSDKVQEKTLDKIKSATEGTESKLGLGHSALKKVFSSMGTWAMIAFGMLKGFVGKIASGIWRVTKLIAKIPFKAIGFIAKGLGTIVRFVIKRFPLIAGALSAFSMGKDAMTGLENAKDWHGVKEGEKVSTSQKVTAAIGGALGGTESGVKGAKSGALKGAGMGMMIGSMIAPGIGTAIGGALGAIAGGVLGFVGGKNIAVALQSTWDSVKNVISAVTDMIMFPFKLMGKLVDKFMDWFKDPEKSALDKVKDIGAMILNVISWPNRMIFKGAASVLQYVSDHIPDFLKSALPSSVMSGLTETITLLNSMSEGLNTDHKSIPKSAESGANKAEQPKTAGVTRSYASGGIVPKPSKPLDGQGGQLALVHEGEKILPKSVVESAKLSGKPPEESRMGSSKPSMVDSIISGLEEMISSSASGMAGNIFGKLKVGYQKVKESLGPSSGFGWLSRMFESAGAGPAAIGWDRTGGYSYGYYQLAEKSGTPQRFLKQFPKIAQQFTGMQVGSDQFNERWKQLASTDPSFGQAQHEFIKQQYLNPYLAKIQKDTGFDLSARSPILQEVANSISVQHGPGSSVVSNALKGLPQNVTDEEMVKKIYEYKYANVGSHFKSSTSQVQKAVANRIQREASIALGSMGSGKGANPDSLPKASKGGVITKTGPIYAHEGEIIGPIKDVKESLLNAMLTKKDVARMQADKDTSLANLFNESTKGIQNSLQDSMNHSGKQTAVIVNSMTNSISSSMNSLAKSVSGGGGGSNQGNDEISAILSGRMQ